MAEKFEPPLEVDLAGNPRKIKFRSITKAKQWAQKERDAWENFLPNPPQNYGHFYARIINQQKQHANAVIHAIDTAAGITEETVVPTDVANSLTPYKQGKCLHSESAVGKLVLSLTDESNQTHDAQAAIGALGAAIDFPVPLNDLRNNKFVSDPLSPYVKGVALYHSWNRPAPDWADAERRAIADALADWADKLSDHENQQERAVTRIGELESQINDLHEAQEHEYGELKGEYETKFKKLEEFYHEKVRTDAPAKYWQRKSFWHTIFGYAFQALFLIGAVYVTFKGYELSSSLPTAIGESTANADLTTGERTREFFGRALALLIPGFFAVWILRVLLKIGLSHLATADDARHRVTMVQTFMSLIEHEGKMEPADRILMLQALFRPTPGRGGDDDTAPPNWFDLLMERVKKT